MMPNDPGPDASYFCPWCGSCIDESDAEDDGFFFVILRCPSCDKATSVQNSPKSYDYSRPQTAQESRIAKIIKEYGRQLIAARQMIAEDEAVETIPEAYDGPHDFRS